MNYTIAHTNKSHHTGPGGVRCQVKIQIERGAAGSRFSVFYLMLVLTQWISTWLNLLRAVIGITPFGSLNQTVEWAHTDARPIGVSGYRLRRRPTPVKLVHTRGLAADTVRSRGIATQTLNNNSSGDSSTQSAEGPPSEIRGSSPGPRISCTRSSVVEHRSLVGVTGGRGV